MSSDLFESGDATGRLTASAIGTQRPVRRLAKLLMILGVLVTAVIVFMPLRRGAPEAARRNNCAGQLRQIGLALQNYVSAHGALPPAYTVDAEGRPLHSWRTLILPYLEQKALYNKIDLSKPWNDPVNKEAYEAEVSVYTCPSVNCPANHTVYVAVVGPNGCFLATEPRKLSEVTDAHDLTVMVIELDAKRHVHWMSPTDISAQEVLSLRPVDERQHSGTFHVALLDGSVRPIHQDLEPDKLGTFISISGNDDAVARDVE